jgi:hypothetical protein
MLQKLGFIGLLAIGLVLVFPSGEPDDVAKLAADAVPALAPADDAGMDAEPEIAAKSSTKAPASETDEEESFVMGMPVEYSEEDYGEAANAFQSPPPPQTKPAYAKPKNTGKAKYRAAPKNTRQPPEMV